MKVVSYRNKASADMINRSPARQSQGHSAIEFACGLVVLVVIILGVVDLCVIYSAVSFNDRVCREASRAAASGPPDFISSGAPRMRARSAIVRANKISSIQVDPDCSVSEKITAKPGQHLAGPVEGSASVETTVTVHPPMLIGAWFGKRGLQFHANESFPITYMATSAQENIQAAPIDDSWQVTIVPARLDQYLSYSGSLVRDVLRLSVFYTNAIEHNGASFSGTSAAATAAGAISAPDTPVHYEDLFYAAQHVVGANRFHTLDVKPNTTGVIRITAGSENASPVDGFGSGNAIGRMFLDLLQKRCIVRQIIVPQASFQDVIAGLCKSGFRQEKDRDPNQIPKVFLQVVSEPDGDKVSVVY